VWRQHQHLPLKDCRKVTPRLPSFFLCHDPNISNFEGMEVGAERRVKMGRFGLIDRVIMLRIPMYLRVFLAWVSFLVALDASIALNRWWIAGSFETYLQNVILMPGGLAIFVALISKSKVEMLGRVFFCTAVYFIGDYEIGGRSELYLTPLDPIFGLGPAFPQGSASIVYRKVMAMSVYVLAALTLATSQLKPNMRNACKNQCQL